MTSHSNTVISTIYIFLHKTNYCWIIWVKSIFNHHGNFVGNSTTSPERMPSLDQMKRNFESSWIKSNNNKYEGYMMWRKHRREFHRYCDKMRWNWHRKVMCQSWLMVSTKGQDLLCKWMLRSSFVWMVEYIISSSTRIWSARQFVNMDFKFLL